MERFGIIMGVSREAVVMMMVRRWWRELEWGRRRGRVSATAKPGRRWGAAAEIEEWQESTPALVIRRIAEVPAVLFVLAL